ncbi:MAG: hypothetical protein ACLRZG_04705 [Streptococcus sp.]
MQNPDFAQGGYSLLVEVLKDVKELAGKDYKAYNIQLSNQNNPVHQISPSCNHSSHWAKNRSSYIGKMANWNPSNVQLNEDKSGRNIYNLSFLNLWCSL